MMNVKKDAPATGKKCAEAAEEKSVAQPKRMADIVPGPGMEEHGFVDTGLSLGSLDISGPSL